MTKKGEGKPYLRVHILWSFGHAHSRAQPLAWPVTGRLQVNKRNTANLTNRTEQNRTLFTLRPFCNGVRGIYIIFSEQDGLQEDIYTNEYIHFFIDTCIQILYVI